MKTILLPVFGITIVQGATREAASISSDMKEEEAPDHNPFNTAVDAIESMILAHFCSGVDVESPAYLEGIEVAYQVICDQL